MWIAKIQIRLQLWVTLAPANKSRYPRLVRPAGRNSYAGPSVRCRPRHRRRQLILKASASSATTTEGVPHRESSCCGQAGIGDPSRLHIATCRLDTVRHLRRRRWADWKTATEPTRPTTRSYCRRPPPRRRPRLRPQFALRRRPAPELAQQSSYFCLKNDFDNRRGSCADWTTTMPRTSRHSSNRHRSRRYRCGRWTNWPATC